MKTLEFIKSLDDRSSSNIRSLIYKKSIMSSYSDDGRMIFYNSKNTLFNNPSELNDLWAETNGLVVDVLNLKILATPPLTFRSNIDVQLVNTYLSNNMYDILLIEDGTVFNLYYWEPLNSWRISTSRGYDMGDCKYSHITYKDIIKELIELNNIEEQEFYDSLNKNSSYTFGFKHSSMHAFWEGNEAPINYMWFIQSVDENGVVSYDFDKFGIKTQKKYNQVNSTKLLFNEIKNSLDNFINEKQVLYGFILRSRDPKVTGLHSNIMLESSLLQKIRQLYYHSNINEIAQKKNYNRELYIIVNSYLNHNLNEVFIELFPQYKNKYEELDRITDNLIKSINVLVNTTTNNTLISDDNLTKIAKTIYNSINSVCELTPRNRQNSRIIATYLLNTKFVDVYYSLFNKE